MQKSGKRILFIFFAGFLASLLFVSCGRGEAPAEADRILSAVSRGANLEIEAELTETSVNSAGGIVYLFALLPGESVSDLGSMTPVAERKAETHLRFTLPAGGENTAALYAKYLLGVRGGTGYTPLTPAAYVTLEHRENPPATASKKGIAAELPGEAESLHAAHALIDLPLDTLLSEQGGLHCEIGETACLLSESGIAELDYRVSTACAAGMRVYLRLILPESARSGDALRYAAAGAFLAERYAGGERGSVKDFVLAFEGGSPTCDIYHIVALFRAVYTAVSLPAPDARLFFSVSCLLNSGDGGSRALLNSLCSELAYNGQIPFGIALDLSAASRLTAPVWEEPLATESLSATYLTVRNLSVLTDYLSREEFLFEGKERPVILTDFSVPCGTEENAEERQAAALAYAYYKTLAEDSVSAIFYAHLYDRADTADGLIRLQGEKRRAYELFAALDTDRGTEAAAFALPLIGVNRWQAVTGKEFSAPVSVVSATLPAVFLAPEKSKNREPLLDFSNGSLSGLYPSQGALSLAIRIRDGEATRAVCTLNAASPEGACGVSAAISALPGKTHWLSLGLAVDAANTENSRILVELSGLDGTRKRVYRADFVLTDGTETVVYLDLSGLTNKEKAAVGRIRILRENDGVPAELSILSAEAILDPAGFFTVVFRVILVLAVVAALALLFLWGRMLILKKRAERRRRRRNEAVNPKPPRPRLH